jgi:cyclohexanecarboxylate-CoA ligase
MFFETRLTADHIAGMTAAGYWRDHVLHDYVRQHAAARPNQPAIVASDRWPQLTFQDLLEWTDRLALRLLDRGIRSGDVVSVQLPNWPEFVLLLLAIERIGAVMNPLTTILRARDLQRMLNIGSTRMLVVPDVFRGFDHAAMARGLAAQVPSLRDVVVVGSRVPGTTSWADLIGDPARPLTDGDRMWLERLRPDPNAPTELAYTSGTSGVPRGVLHTHNTALGTVGSTLRRQAIHADSVIHVATPVGHNAGYFYGVRLALQAGASMVLQDQWQPELMARLIERHGITFTMGATTFLLDLLGVPNLERYDLRSLAVFMCGGASIPPVIAREAARRLPGRLCPVFGMTEHGHSTGTDPWTPDDKVSSTDGSPQPEAEFRVVDDTGRVLPARQEGRLKLRYPFNFVGYIQGRAFTEPSFDGEDFFDTGDIAYLDADGYVRITGRAKDLVIRGGENVPVKEVEDLIATYPGVLEVAVVGAPDPRLGERAVACVRVSEGVDLSLDALQQFLREQRLTQQFWPEAVRVVADFPRTASGKIQKFHLREDLVESFARDTQRQQEGMPT